MSLKNLEFFGNCLNVIYQALQGSKGSWVREEVRLLSLSLVAKQKKARGAEQGSTTAVMGSDIRPAAALPLKTHFLSGLTGLLLCDALSTEHTELTGLRMWKPHSWKFTGEGGGHDSLMRGGVSVIRSWLGSGHWHTEYFCAFLTCWGWG